MKTITPISIWDNGKNEEVIILNANCTNDNLSNYCTFYYSLLNNEMKEIAKGNLYMSGEDYIAWETNEYAYDWIATQLNLTITGDYVPPVVEQKAEPIELNNNLE
jgi:hypothetical protein